MGGDSSRLPASVRTSDSPAVTHGISRDSPKGWKRGKQSSWEASVKLLPPSVTSTAPRVLPRLTPVLGVV